MVPTRPVLFIDRQSNACWRLRRTSNRRNQTGMAIRKALLRVANMKWTKVCRAEMPIRMRKPVGHAPSVDATLMVPQWMPAT